MALRKQLLGIEKYANATKVTDIEIFTACSLTNEMIKITMICISQQKRRVSE